MYTISPPQDFHGFLIVTISSLDMLSLDLLLTFLNMLINVFLKFGDFFRYDVCSYIVQSSLFSRLITYQSVSLTLS